MVDNTRPVDYMIGHIEVKDTELPAMIECCKCHTEKPETEFHPSAIKNRYYRCRKCEYERNRVRRADFDLEKVSKIIKCYKCHNEKHKTEFHPSNLKKSDYRCKTCFNKYNDINRKKAHPLKTALRGAKRRAKEKELDFNLKFEDLHIPKRCPVLGIELATDYQDSKGHRDNAPSLDRLDSSKGYTVDNVRVISWRANNIKSAATAEELEAVAAWMRLEQSDIPV